MGLYLVIFDEFDEEVEGVEVGRYKDFSIFSEHIELVYGRAKAESEFPSIFLHSVSDGEWTSIESKKLLIELNIIKNDFKKKPPITFNNGWQDDLRINYGLPNNNLYESFIDIDGELLIDRLIELAEISIKVNSPILFQ